MDPEKTKTPDSPPQSAPARGPGSAAEQSEPPGPNPELDEFFQRLPSNLRWPLPSEAAIAAAVEAIQRISGGGEPDRPGTEQRPATAPDSGAAGGPCVGCGQPLDAGMRFCGHCGTPAGHAASSSDTASTQDLRPGQHHYHHHYHHFIGVQGSPARPARTPEEVGVPRRRVSGSSTGFRAEITARQLVQDWVQACNTKHLDDILELYTSDATLIRPNVLPVRSLPAIREFLFALLEAGLGDIEMESLRTEILGDIALDIGRCKMLVPVTMGKRREERGKYLIVMVRQPAGHWKIIADCWSTDLSVSSVPPSDTARKLSEPGPAK